MSELIDARTNRNIRHHLLTTVSAMALLVLSFGTSDANSGDQDSDRPTVWIELGGQMEHIAGQGDSFVPGFLAANPHSPVLQSTTPVEAQRPVPFAFGEQGTITFLPSQSDWLFSASLRFGRSNNFKKVDHQISRTGRFYHSGILTNRTFHADFSNTQVRNHESHAILDFVVGKDVGLGMFSREGSSFFNFGIRFAQLSSSGTVDNRARPDLGLKYFPSSQAPNRAPFVHFHTYHFAGDASRSFRGVGPTLSWTGSQPVVGDTQNGELAVDFGVNGGLLFGRQKAHVTHNESGHYDKAKYQLDGTGYHLVYQRSGGHDTDRALVVPNVGGFAGISLKWSNAKISFGYRTDFFFGAMDGGIDERQSDNLGFNGPFATLSVGLGG